MRRVAFTIAGVVAAMVATSGRGQESTEPRPGEIGRLGASARPLGLGEAFTAVADPTASLWNPAALSGVRHGALHVSHRDVRSGLRIDTGNLAVRPRGSERVAVGVSATLLHLDAAGTENESEFLGNVGSAFQVTSSLALGVEFGRVESTFQDSGVARGWNTGAGVLWASGPTAVGVAVRGVSFGMSGEDGDYPYRYRLSAGVAHQFDSTLLFAAQVDRDRAGDPVLGMGAEWLPDPRLAVRGGVRQEFGEPLQVPRYSAGLGLLNHGVSLDYAARFNEEQAPEHVVSLGYRFGAVPTAAEATPQVANTSAAATTSTDASPPDVPPPVAVPEREPVQPPAAAPSTEAERRAKAKRNAPIRYVVRAGVHLNFDAAADEAARFYRANLRAVVEPRGSSHVVVLIRCATFAEARSWVRHAAEKGLRCYIDEE